MGGRIDFAFRKDNSFIGNRNRRLGLSDLEESGDFEVYIGNVRR